jgi:dihydrofolate synthase/folylpolyglutamate synthase
MVDALLCASGVRTGRTISPHLQSATERIALGGVPVSTTQYLQAYYAVEPLVDEVDAWSAARGGSRLSKFEIVTAMAFWAFAQAEVDVAVVEVGLGGRWDATNVVDAAAMVVTPVAVDHTNYLGDTLTQIASQKAGILNKNSSFTGATPCAVFGRQYPDAAEVLNWVAREQGLTALCLGIDFGVVERRAMPDGQVLRLREFGLDYGDIRLPLHGDYQAENAAVALAAVQSGLRAMHLQPMTRDQVREGFASVLSPGRLERVSVRPDVFVDVAHNPHGAQALAGALAEMAPSREITAVVAVARDKDAHGVLSALKGVVDSVVVTENGSTRAMPVVELGRIADEVFGADNVSAAVPLATAITVATAQPSSPRTRAHVTVVTGSVVTAGVARALFGLAPA